MYWIGSFIALCVNIVILIIVGKKEKEITLGDIFWTFVICLASWVELILIMFLGVVILIGESGNIIIWKSKEK